MFQKAIKRKRRQDCRFKGHQAAEGTYTALSIATSGTLAKLQLLTPNMVAQANTLTCSTSM